MTIRPFFDTVVKNLVLILRVVFGRAVPWTRVFFGPVPH